MHIFPGKIITENYRLKILKRALSSIINFHFHFLGLGNVYFYNYFANELIRWVVF
jgi:hypothetical protein